MRTLYKYFFLLLFPIYTCGQINLFHSNENRPLFIDYSDSLDIRYYNKDQSFALDPRFFVISSTNKSDFVGIYLVGANLSTNIINKLTFNSNFDYLSGNYNSLLNEYQDSLLIFPDFGRENFRVQYNLKYDINKFIAIDFGKGKHFIGSGYRSLFLSTKHSPYPYLKLTTEFGRIRYYNLYTTFLDINLKQKRKKHSSIHFLNFSLTESINIGIFEGVIWQSKDKNYDRGYDVEYLNPIIFYRPVEFSKHSPDNVLLGVTFNAKFKKTTLYSQVLLDDLNISRQKNTDDNYSAGFFQNKFAYQLGIKSSFKSVDVLIEYNQVQPYTYAHKVPMQSYTHLNQSLTHPLGANLKELVALANYTNKNWSFNIKLTYAKVGLDSLNTHYGQNIFASDFEAQADGDEYSYGNFNGQGFDTEIYTIHPEVTYSFKNLDFFGSVFYKNKKSNLIDHNSLWYSVGIRTFLFSAFQDY